jgi:GGDEF domain-containing protein
VATLIPDHTDDAIQFLSSADKRLYAAKQRGRNCVVSA